MQIRTKLTFQFLLIGMAIMIISSIITYYSSASVRKEDFYNRLRNKAINTTRFIIEFKDIDINKVRQLEKGSPVRFENEKIIILDFKNDIIYSTDENKEIDITLSVLERIRSGYKVSYRQGEYEVMGTFYYSEGRYDRYIILAAAVDAQGNQHLEKLRLILVIVCLFSFLLLFVAGWFYSGRALKPISDVINRVEEISISSLNLRLDEGNGTDELGRLAKTFNNMLQRLETSFALQKNFISNASHELRTPLTAINGQLEVLIMKDRSSEEYKMAVTSVLEDIQSMIDLLNKLLLMARTSGEGVFKISGGVRIDEILWLAREELIKFHKDYKVSIHIHESLDDSEKITISGDENLIKVALYNILENGCKYSGDHAVEVTLKGTDKHLEVVFKDHGAGISEEDIQKVFEPFYRGKNAHIAKGTGVGMALVKQIITLHNGKIGLTSKTGQGTNVTLSFPINNP